MDKETVDNFAMWFVIAGYALFFMVLGAIFWDISGNAQKLEIHKTIKPDTLITIENGKADTLYIYRRR